ncbi:MAG TPA: AraC family transcriptional regulator [Ramlibacter sp.]|nr:AraC family transcriptional regulator [Ramlibacter sp.]
METRNQAHTREDARQVMWIDADRVLYAGLLGRPSMRTLGAHVTYVGLDAPVELSLEDGSWRRLLLGTVGPYVSHQVRCEARRVGVILVEPELVSTDELPAWPTDGHAAAASAFVARIRDACGRLGVASPAELKRFDFDVEVFGAPLSHRVLDPRIKSVVDAIRRDPCGQTSGEAYARSVHLSLSRFVHLFKSEIGVPLRRYRSWRRARHLLHHATSDSSLVNIALAAGYPDSTHFSHSIRQAFGLTPGDILAGSRRLAVHAVGRASLTGRE